MIISTIAGTLYGMIFSFLNDFTIVIMNNVSHPYKNLYNSCNIHTNVLFASYAYYFIMKEYGWIFLQQHKPTSLEMLLYFGFIFPALIVYPSEFTCAFYHKNAEYMFERIIISPATMISTTLIFESSGVHQGLINWYYQ